MCTEVNFIFLVMADRSSEAVSFKLCGWCVFLFYINRFHPVDGLHLHTKLEKVLQLNIAPAQVS